MNVLPVRVRNSVTSIIAFFYTGRGIWKGLITFTPFHVPLSHDPRGGGAARCRVKAAVRHTASSDKVFITFFKAKKKKE